MLCIRYFVIQNKTTFETQSKLFSSIEPAPPGNLPPATVPKGPDGKPPKGPDGKVVTPVGPDGKPEGQKDPEGNPTPPDNGM